MASDTKPFSVVVEVSDDRLSASCRVTAGLAPNGAPVSEVIAAAQARGVKLDKDRLDALLPGDLLAPDLTIVVAKGRAPVDTAPARIELIEESQPVPERGTSASHYERRGLRITAADQTIAIWHPAVHGRDGVDVFGSPLAYKADARTGDALGQNVKLMPDDCTVVAVRAGAVRFESGRLAIEPELNISGNVDFATGNVAFPGNIHITGNVVDLFKVEADGDVEIDGMVEAAEAKVRGTMTVRGGIIGKDKCVCRVGGDLSARYIANATVRAGGNITVQKEVANCRVVAGGMVCVDKGVIVAGQVAAAGGIRCSVVGSPDAVKTIIEVGVDHALRDRCGAQIAQLEGQRREAQKIRQTVEPLLRLQKNLTAGQKEKATELLFNADGIDREIAVAVQDLQQHALALQANSRAELSVTRTIHAGTVVRFPRTEATINATLAGPVRIVCVGHGSEWRVSVVGHGGSSFLLPSRSVPDKILDALARLGAAAIAAAA